MLEKEFIPHTEALELRKLGFDEECLAFYFRERETEDFRFKLKGGIGAFFGQQFNAHLYQQAFRWFREKHKIEYSIQTSSTLFYLAYDFKVKGDFKEGYFKSKQFNNYEEAELECLKKLIEVVKLKL